MPVTLVTDPADMDRDAAVHPWTRRLKYARVEELLADYVAANAAIGRPHCPVADYFRAHLDDDILEVEALVYAHPEWGPQALAESCHATLAFNNARSHPHGREIAAWAQHYCLLHLVRHHPYERARGAVRGHAEASAHALRRPRSRLRRAGLPHRRPSEPAPLPGEARGRAKFPADLDVAALPRTRLRLTAEKAEPPC